MLKAGWLVTFVATMLAFLFVLAFPYQQKADLANGAADAPLPIFNDHSPLQLNGTWLFVENQFLKPSELSLPPVLASNQIPTVTRTDFKFSQNRSNPLSVRGTVIGTINTPTSNTVSAGQGAIKVDPHCGIKTAYIYGPELLDTGDILPVYQKHAKVAAVNLLQSNPIQNIGFFPISNATAQRFIFHVEGIQSQCQNPVIGSVDAVLEYNNREIIKNAVLVAILFAIAMYSTGIYVYFQRSQDNLCLGALALLSTIFVLIETGLYEFFVGGIWSFELSAMQKVFVLSQVLFGPLLLFYLKFSLNAKPYEDLFIKINAVLGCALALVFSFSSIELVLNYSWLIPPYVLIQCLAIAFLSLRAFADNLKIDTAINLGAVGFIIFAICADSFWVYWQTQNIVLSHFAWLFLLLLSAVRQSRLISQAFSFAAMQSEQLSREVHRKTETLEVKNRLLLQVQEELERTNAELKTLSVTDGLTGAHNRLYFDRQFQVEWQRSLREQEALSLLLLDIDHFKNINDDYGHLVGDQCLKTFAIWIENLFKRSNDIICRYGGEEFAVILPNTPPSQALKTAELLRAYVEKTPVEYSGKALRMTISIGICGTIPRSGMASSDLIRAADKALYHVKRNGRNGVKLENLETKARSVPTVAS